MNYIRNTNSFLKLDEINDSKKILKIDLKVMNESFDSILTKAFRLAFVRAENIRNGLNLRPFDCSKISVDEDSKKLCSQIIDQHL